VFGRAKLDEVRCDSFRQCRRKREPNSDGTRRRSTARNRNVDSDELAPSVEKSSAGIPGVDGRVGLDDGLGKVLRQRGTLAPRKVEVEAVALVRNGD